MRLSLNAFYIYGIFYLSVQHSNENCYDGWTFFIWRKYFLSCYIFQSIRNEIVEDRSIFPLRRHKMPLSEVDSIHLFLLLFSASGYCMWYLSIDAPFPGCPRFQFFSRYWPWTPVNEFSKASGIKGYVEPLGTRINHLLCFLCNESLAPSNNKTTQTGDFFRVR